MQKLKFPEYRHPLQRFQKLMPHRVRRLLLVASRYDSFLLGEDGRLQDLILTEFLDLSLDTDPWFTRVSTGERALAAVSRRRFDLVVLTHHVRDMSVFALARKLKEIQRAVCIVPLAFDDRELQEFRERWDGGGVFEQPFVWQGDFRLLLGIMHCLEDRWNVEHDTERAHVSSVILIEDSVHYYSSFLPMLYDELMQQSHRVIAEGLNLQNKLMRLRARPKILHCTSFEEARKYYQRYRRYILGIISDVSFPRDGVVDRDAGMDFARMVRADKPDLPILLQTNDVTFEERAREVQAEVVLKNSPVLLKEVSEFIHHNFGFGDFVFRTQDGSEVVLPGENGTEAARARDVRVLESMLYRVPGESIDYHARRHHFSTWLRARTEFQLAEDLRKRRVDEFDSPDDVRMYLIEALREFRRDRQSRVVSAFSPDEFHADCSFAQIGQGSLGGKARGLAFVRQVIANYRIRKRFAGIEIAVPSAVVLATDVFDRFVADNGLRDFALEERDDAIIEARFIGARFPEEVFRALNEFLDLVDFPLAVRSSSLLEDSQYFPFTGVYKTYMVPNCDVDRSVRVEQLVRAIKRVYASTFFQRAKDYIRRTPYRLEEERMAVLVQRLVGIRHGRRFYPDFSGVARSYNFYPMAPMRPEDGIVSVALGLGETVVGGGRCVSFCPLYPQHPVYFSTPEAILQNSQTDFFALDLSGKGDPTAELHLSSFGIEQAMEDGTLAPLASVYAPESHAVYDGLARDGSPLVTFAPVLKHALFPLPTISQLLLDVGSRSMNRPVEIEFAVNFQGRNQQRAEFAVLQMRPFVLHLSTVDVDLRDHREEDLVCRSTMVLGGGVIEGIRDLVVVHRDTFERSRSMDVAQEVGRLNALLQEEGVPYLLIGVGRWGASDPWLGVPVTWEQISGARVIVESSLRDIEVAPSQGSHFFQNLTAAGAGYFTVPKDPAQGSVDWDWLRAIPGTTGSELVRHIRLEQPVCVRMDGRRGHGVILKPGASG